MVSLHLAIDVDQVVQFTRSSRRLIIMDDPLPCVFYDCVGSFAQRLALRAALPSEYLSGEHILLFPRPANVRVLVVRQVNQAIFVGLADVMG